MIMHRRAALEPRGLGWQCHMSWPNYEFALVCSSAPPCGFLDKRATVLSSVPPSVVRSTAMSTCIHAANTGSGLVGETPCYWSDQHRATQRASEAAAALHESLVTWATHPTRIVR